MSDERVKYTLTLEDAFSRPMNKASRSTDRFDRNTQSATKSTDKFKANLKSLAGVAAGVLGGLGIREIAMDLREVGESETLVNAVTETTAENVKDLAKQARAIGNAFRENNKEIVQSANALEENFNIPFSQALDLINEGFSKGANISGNLLDQLKEYPGALRNSGLRAEEFIGFIAQAGQSGLFDDRATDALKEFNIALGDASKEGEGVRKVIDGLGDGVLDQVLALNQNGMGFKSFQLIAKKITEVEDKAKQTKLISEIFKGPGEDIPTEFFETIANEGVSSITEMESKVSDLEQASQTLRITFSDIKSTITGSFGPAFIQIAEWVKEFKDEIITAIKVVAVFAGTGGAIWGLVTAVTALANPVTAVIAGIGALTAGIAYLWNNSEGFKNTVLSIWEVLKNQLGPTIMDLWRILKDAFNEVWKDLKQIFKDLQPVLEMVGKFIGGVLITAIKLAVFNIKIMVRRFQFIVAIFTDIVNAGKRLAIWFSEVWPSVVDFIVTPFEIAFNWVRKEFEVVANFFEKIVGKITGFFTNMFPRDTILGNLKKLLVDVAKPVNKFLEFIGFGNTAQTLRDFVNDLTTTNASSEQARAGRDEFMSDRGERSKELGRSAFEASFGDGTTEKEDNNFANDRGFDLSNSQLDSLTTSSPSDKEMSTKTSSSSSGGSGRSITINIESLVENLSITSQNVAEGAERTRDEIARALTLAIQDATVATN